MYGLVYYYNKNATLEKGKVTFAGDSKRKIGKVIDLLHRAVHIYTYTTAQLYVKRKRG